jgi:hypothetical protein
LRIEKSIKPKSKAAWDETPAGSLVTGGEFRVILHHNHVRKLIREDPTALPQSWSDPVGRRFGWYATSMPIKE